MGNRDNVRLQIERGDEVGTGKPGVRDDFAIGLKSEENKIKEITKKEEPVDTKKEN